MKKLLNTLYITKQESYVHKENKTIVIRLGREKVAQFPILSIGNILCFGQISVSPPLMGFCGEEGVGLSFYSEYGKFLARIQGKQNGNVLLRRAQYRVSDDKAKTLSISRVIIGSKIANSRSILMRHIRNYGDNQEVSSAIVRLASSLRQCQVCEDLDVLRGIEGEAASVYFSAFNCLIRIKDFTFFTRSRRPPCDPVNALLSFVYTLLTNDIASALQGVGLDPQVGFLHRDRPGRVSLALDILEEMRSAFADRFVLSIINRSELKIDDFIKEESGAVRLKEEARKIFLSAWQQKKQEQIMHPYFQERIPMGLLPHCQAMLLARHLRGDTEFYPPFVVK
jgi:CRISPR-associated protein Cas1